MTSHAKTRSGSKSASHSEVILEKNPATADQPATMDVDPPAAQYNDSNRAFLQSFLARGTMTLEEAKVILAAIFTIDSGPFQPHLCQAGYN